MPQITGVDHFVIAEGETVTVTGNELNGATKASMLWGSASQVASSAATSVNANTVEFTMPDVRQESRDYHLLLETETGSTLGIPSGYYEHTVVGEYSGWADFVVVRAGAVLSGDLHCEIVYVETGGVFEPESSFYIDFIFAEDGAIIDLSSVSSYRHGAIIYASPDAIIIEDNGFVDIAEIPSLDASFGISTFTVGYLLDISIQGSGAVDVSPDKSYYSSNESVQLIATPTEGNTFIGWTGDAVSSDATIEESMTSGGLSVTANFASGWILEIYEIPGVTVSLSPDLPVYDDGQEVSLSVSLEPGYSFVGWEFDASGAVPNTSVLMDSHKTVMPVVRPENFDELPLMATADHFVIPEGETVSVSGSGLDGATQVSMLWGSSSQTATSPAASVDAFTVDFEMPDVRQESRDYHLFLETTIGSTLGIPSGFYEHTESGEYSDFYRSDIVVVRAGAVLGGDLHCEMVYVEAGGVFMPDSSMYVDFIFAEDGAVIDLTAITSYRHGSTIYSSPGALVLEDNGYVEIESIASLKPSFGFNTFTVGYLLDVSIQGEGTVTVSPDKDYYVSGESVQLTANPAPGNTFSGWTGDVISSNATIQESVTSAGLSLNANFAQGWIVSVYDIPGASVSLVPDQSVYADGQEVTIVLTLEPGYVFLGWELDASGDALSTSLLIDSHKTVMPVVKPDIDLPHVSNADFFVIPEGEKVNLTGTNLDGATEVSMLWGSSSQVASSAATSLDANTVEFAMPDVRQESRDYLMLLETTSGSTLGIPSGFYEHAVIGEYDGWEDSVVVREGAMLLGARHIQMVYVETGGVFIAESDLYVDFIFVEDGAVVDLSAITSYRFGPKIYQSPDAVIIADNGHVDKEVIPSLNGSFGLSTFTVGYLLDLVVEGPGSVTVSPMKPYYSSGESVELTAVEDLDAYFIRWIGSVSSRDTVISYSAGRNGQQIARFSSSPDYFSNWRLRHFTTEELQDSNISAFDADPDRDSFSNAAEYALGTDPRDPNSSNTIEVKRELVDGELRFIGTYTRPRDALDVTYQILVSTDLVTWNFNGDSTDILYSEEMSVEAIDEEIEKVTLLLYPEFPLPKIIFIRISAILFD
ncbi:MAG: InlB B-repeat-containing protein [Opitutales bacterium]